MNEAKRNEESQKIKRHGKSVNDIGKIDCNILKRTMETANRCLSAGRRIGMTGRVSNSRSKKPLASGERLLALIPQKLNCHSE